MTENITKLSVRLPIDLFNRMTCHCFGAGITLTELVRCSVHRHLNDAAAIVESPKKLTDELRDRWLGEYLEYNKTHQ